MNAPRDSGRARDLLALALRRIRKKHGGWMADAPETHDLIAAMIESGTDDEARLVAMVEMACGKRSAGKPLTFH
ncbi:MAG: hypothetical protein QE284_20175 [Rhizobium sp.]|nr:hypothetical protein [Rhizobium sp.]